MTAYTGNAFPFAALLNNGSASVDLNPMARPTNASTDRVLQPTPLVTTGANVFNEPIDVRPALSAAGAAFKAHSFGDFFFERIHLLPKSASYPFILSTQLVQLEVWNAYRETSQTVTVVTLTGPPGVAITTPHGTPIVFSPLQARIYTVEISASGAPRADNTILFDFSGINEPVFHITGLRLVPFTISPDWQDPVQDVYAYFTDVMTAYDETEQRQMLRSLPNRALSYTAAALNDREAGLLISLLFAWQDRSYGTLLWMDGSALTADVATGSTVIPVDTSTMVLGADSIVILISDAFYWFAGPVDSFTGSSITLSTPTDRDFFAKNTTVIPVVMGRVADTIPVDRANNVVSSTKIKFDLQVVGS